MPQVLFDLIVNTVHVSVACNLAVVILYQNGFHNIRYLIIVSRGIPVIELYVPVIISDRAQFIIGIKLYYIRYVVLVQVHELRHIDINIAQLRVLYRLNIILAH